MRESSSRSQAGRPPRTWLPGPLRAVLRGRLRARVVPVDALDDAARRRLWALYQTHYERVTEAQFLDDLGAKDDVILLRDVVDGTIQGFTTMSVHRHRPPGGNEVAVLFSGDTVITPAYHRQRALHRAFVAYAVRARARHRGLPLYWFLISKGYRTYLLLSRNFPEHWPRHDRPTPRDAQALIDSLAARRFGEAYRPEAGVVRFDRPGPRLRPGVVPIAREDTLPDDIRFFLARNPGHAEGDELCCIGRVDVAMVMHFSRRVARHAAETVAWRLRGVWARA